jgi:dihydrofolate reductase
MSHCKAILYIACSLDGYIAAPGDNLDFLDVPPHNGEKYGYDEFIAGIGAIVLGKRTFDWVHTKVPAWPHQETTYVWTRTPKASAGNVHFITGDLAAFVAQLKETSDKNIFIDGGGEVVHECLKHDLLDEIIISYIPVLLGNGTPLFRSGRSEQWLELVAAKGYPSGVVQVHYQRKRQ